MTSRRELLIGVCACGSAFAFSSRSHAAEPISKGCYLLNEKVANLPGASNRNVVSLASNGSLLTTGNADMDKALGLALVHATTFYGQKPSFSFYDDTGALNAYASPETDPTVLGTRYSMAFGVNLFHMEIEQYDPTGMSVLAVISHELGHLVQFDKGYGDKLDANQPTVRRSELHADALAGFYLGSRKLSNPGIRLWSAGDLFHRLGDTAFGNPQHHGTPDERTAASEFGYKLAYDEKRSFVYACDATLEYALSL